MASLLSSHAQRFRDLLPDREAARRKRIAQHAGFRALRVLRVFVVLRVVRMLRGVLCLGCIEVC